jgi:hypothetical protein
MKREAFLAIIRIRQPQDFSGSEGTSKMTQDRWNCDGLLWLSAPQI